MAQNSPHNNHIEEIPFLKSIQEYVRYLLSRDPLSYEVDRKYYKKLVWLHPPPSHDIFLIRYFLSRFKFKQFDAPDSYFKFRYFYPRQESLHVTVHKKRDKCTIKAHLDIIKHKEGCSNELTFELLSSLNSFLRREYPTSLFYLKSLKYINQKKIDTIKRFLEPEEIPNKVGSIIPSAEAFPLKSLSTITRPKKIPMKSVRKSIQKKPSQLNRNKRFAKPPVIKNATSFIQEEGTVKLPQEPIISSANNKYKKGLENHRQLESNQDYGDMDHYLDYTNKILKKMAQGPVAPVHEDIQIVKQKTQARRKDYFIIDPSSYCPKFCRQTVEKVIKTTSHANLPKVFVKLKLKAAYFCMVEKIDSRYRSECLQQLKRYLQNNFKSDYKTFRNRHHPRMSLGHFMKVLCANRSYLCTSIIFNVLAVVVGYQFFSLSAYEKQFLFETSGELVFLLAIFLGLALYCFCRLCQGVNRILKSENTY